MIYDGYLHVYAFMFNDIENSYFCCQYLEYDQSLINYLDFGLDKDMKNLLCSLFRKSMILIFEYYDFNV